jgi:hypothetical protein
MFAKGNPHITHKKEVAVVKEDTSSMSFALENLLMNMNSEKVISSKVDTHLSNIKSLCYGLERMSEVRDIISEHGVNKSFLSYINKENCLTNLVPQIPSLENFTFDMSKNKSQHVVDGLEAYIKYKNNELEAATEGLFKDFSIWILKMVNKVKHAQACIDEAYKKTEHKKYDTERAKTIKVEAIDYHKLMKIIENCGKAPDIAIRLIETLKPSESFNNNDVRHMENKIEEEFNHILKSLNIDIHGATIKGDGITSSGTWNSFGYSEHSIKSIIEHLNKTVHNFSKFNTVVEKIIAAKNKDYARHYSELVDHMKRLINTIYEHCIHLSMLIIVKLSHNYN